MDREKSSVNEGRETVRENIRKANRNKTVLA